jgi:hypothetical protein
LAAITGYFIDACSTILTRITRWRGRTIIDVILAILAVIAIGTDATVIGISIDTLSAILTGVTRWGGCTVIDVILAIFAVETVGAYAAVIGISIDTLSAILTGVTCWGGCTVIDVILAIFAVETVGAYAAVIEPLVYAFAAIETRFTCTIIGFGFAVRAFVALHTITHLTRCLTNRPNAAAIEAIPSIFTSRAAYAVLIPIVATNQVQVTDSRFASCVIAVSFGILTKGHWQGLTRGTHATAVKACPPGLAGRTGFAVLVPSTAADSVQLTDCGFTGLIVA